jgi:hypothetical protein
MNITKWPVVIIANYRTGSSELAERISNFYNAVNIPEPKHDPLLMDTLQDMVNDGDNKFVLKLIVDQIDTHPIYRKILQDCYSIKLTRKDVLANMVSYYIASWKGTWQQTELTVPKYSVEYDPFRVDFVVDQILTNNKLLAELSIVFNKTLFYEDLDFTNSDRFKTTPPENLEIITSIIRRIAKL